MNMRQRGATLTGLMVGLMISMVVVLATLGLYQSLVRATGTAQQDTRQDTLRSASLLSAGMALQDAGFGLEAPDPQAQLLRVAAQAGVALLWMQNTGAQSGPQCTGLFAPDRGGLLRLPAQACTDLAGWNWQAGLAPLLAAAADQPPQPRVAIALEPSAACSPYGMSLGPFQAPRVVLASRSHTGVELTSTHCLVNFAAPPGAAGRAP